MKQIMANQVLCKNAETYLFCLKFHSNKLKSPVTISVESTYVDISVYAFLSLKVMAAADLHLINQLKKLFFIVLLNQKRILHLRWLEGKLTAHLKKKIGGVNYPFKLTTQIIIIFHVLILVVPTKSHGNS